MTELCPSCRADRDAWLRYRPTYPIKIASGASRDDTVAGVLDNRRARAESTYQLIRDQIALIHRICAAKHHTSDTPTSA